MGIPDWETASQPQPQLGARRLGLGAAMLWQAAALSSCLRGQGPLGSGCLSVPGASPQMHQEPFRGHKAPGTLGWG